MRTYKFQANVQDGHIEIPDEYKSVINTPVRVFIITDLDFSADKSRQFPDLGLDMSGYKFNRQEANAR